MPCHKATMGKHYKPNKNRKVSAKQRAALKGGRKLLKTLRKARKVSEPKEMILITQGRAGAKKSMAAHKKHKKAAHHPKVYHVLRGEPFAAMHGKAPATDQLMGLGLDAVSLLGGAVVSSFGANMVPVKNAKIKSLIPVALGVGTMLTPAGKNRIVRGAALGATAIGLFSLLRNLVPQLPLLAGEESAETIAAAIDRLPDEEKAILGITDQTEQTTSGDYTRMEGAEEMEGGADEFSVQGEESEAAAGDYQRMEGEDSEVQGLEGKGEAVEYLSPASMM